MAFTKDNAKAAQARGVEQRKRNTVIKNNAMESLVSSFDLKAKLPIEMAKDVYKDAFLQQQKFQHELELIEAKKNAAIEIEMAKFQANIELIEADEQAESANE
ncbi:hypothetical protein AN944_02306 [Shewanella sp. P1-14-1]|uniref:hypothetical protein n=1 Tax=Shewanella sp. P1-14-1 TaxID=1723761 RepID=UPI0006D66EC6|nr:hypothetical protein [Shewanella sp. P1-14-1]KPZ70234.1 hypothetical protein AN944_02306 [Shewanella sp. P1-14-1]